MQHAPSGARGWLTVTAAALAVFMSMLDMTAVTTVLPELGRDLGVTPLGAQWALIAYTGAIVAFLLPSGRWLDSVGARAALLLSVSGFVVASVLITVAPTMLVLALVRAVQGVFAALLLAQVPGLVMHAVPGSVTGRAIAVVGTVGPLGAVTGPPAGSVLKAVAGWEAVFLLNIPLGLLVATLVVISVPRGGGLRPPPLDVLVEAAAAVAAGAALFTGLTLAAEPAPHWPLVAASAGLAVVLIAVWTRMPAGRAAVDLLRRPPLRAAVSVQLLLSLVGGALLLLAPFSLHFALAADAAQTGLVLLAAPLAMSVAGPLGGVLTDRWGAGRIVLLGAAVTLPASVVLALAPHEGGPALLGLRLAAVGVGLGLAAGPAQTTAVREAPVSRRGTAGAVSSTARQLGFALAPPLCTAVWLVPGGSAADLARAYLVAPPVALLAVVVAVVLVRGPSGGPSPLHPPSTPRAAERGNVRVGKPRRFRSR